MVNWCAQLTNETHQQYQKSESFGVIGLGFIATITHQCAFMCKLSTVFYVQLCFVVSTHVVK
jgi:hypothetical protein